MTVAEGIENATQKEMVSDMEIDFGQGWFFGKPFPISYWKKQMSIKNS